MGSTLLTLEQTLDPKSFGSLPAWHHQNGRGGDGHRC